MDDNTGEDDWKEGVSVAAGVLADVVMGDGGGSGEVFSEVVADVLSSDKKSTQASRLAKKFNDINERYEEGESREALNTEREALFSELDEAEYTTESVTGIRSGKVWLSAFSDGSIFGKSEDGHNWALSGKEYAKALTYMVEDAYKSRDTTRHSNITKFLNRETERAVAIPGKSGVVETHLYELNDGNIIALDLRSNGGVNSWVVTGQRKEDAKTKLEKASNLPPLSYGMGWKRADKQDATYGPEIPARLRRSIRKKQEGKPSADQSKVPITKPGQPSMFDEMSTGTIRGSRGMHNPQISRPDYEFSKDKGKSKRGLKNRIKTPRMPGM